MDTRAPRVRAAQRQAARRERLKLNGQRTVTTVLDESSIQALNELTETYGSQRKAINTVLCKAAYLAVEHP